MIKNRIRIVLKLNIAHSEEPLSGIDRNIFVPHTASARFYDLLQHELSCKSTHQWKFTGVENTQLDQTSEFYLLWFYHSDSRSSITSRRIPFYWIYWVRSPHSVVILAEMLVINTMKGTRVCDASVLNEEVES